jgi:hypothetical protein
MFQYVCLLLFLFYWTAEFPQIGKANRLSPYLSVLGKFALRAGRKVLMEVDDNSVLIGGNPYGFLG